MSRLYSFKSFNDTCNFTGKYKLRAESFTDICEFMNLISRTKYRIFEIKIEQINPDFTMEFRSEMNIRRIKKLLLKGIDLHVMAETVKPIYYYDGKRDNSDFDESNTDDDLDEEEYCRRYDIK